MHRWIVSGTVFLAGILCLLALAPSEARAAERVAVMEMRTSGIEQDVATVFSEILTAEIDSLGRYEVVSSADIKTMLGFEAEKQVLGCEEDASCLAEIGGALGVERLVAGQVGRVGGTYVVNLKLIHIPTARTEKRTYQPVSGPIDDVLVTIRTSVRKLFADVPAPEPAAERAPSPAQDPVAAATSPAGVTSPAGEPVAPARGGGIGAAPIALWAVGAVGVGTGVFFGLDAADKHALAGDPTLVGSQRAIEDGERSMLFANVGYAAGATAVVAGTVLLLLSGEEPAAEPRLSVVPVTAPALTGFAATVRF